ncbi:hypothetical protein [Ruania zhangjianzhongii]|uniref:hypothetical protein n=1 Tax=Ruania zhangjianzhongii TaxID=2603206 RepID=UPI0011CBBFAD|nr:hypothetical protein [Ruania zhangjianzhongii]
MSRLKPARIATAALALVLLVAVPAQAAPVREVITGDVLRLVSVQDPAAMGSMSPGETVAWDVEVGASEPEGEIALELAADHQATGFRVSVHECTGEGEGCSRELLAPAEIGPEATEVGSQVAEETLWYRISVQLAGEEPARTVLTFTAHGHGDEISTDGEAELPDTGASPWLPIGLAAGALVVGVLLARLAAVRRRKGNR